MLRVKQKQALVHIQHTMAQADQDGCNITIVNPDKFILKDSNHGSSILAGINTLRSEQIFTDASILAGHEEFPCHRNILAASSPYFKAMFTSRLREDTDATVSFNETEISPWTMKRILDYIYTGHLEITTNNAQELLSASTLFQYSKISNACCQFLTSQLHASNCLGFEEYAHLHDCTQLEEDANKYALENFSVVVEQDEFVRLSVDRLKVYLKSDWIDVAKEETVYDAMMSWIKSDIDERKKYLFQLLELIRLPVVDFNRLDIIESERLIKGCEKCRLLVKEAREQHETIHDQHGRRRRSMQNCQVQPRPSTVATEKIVVIAGWNSYVTRKVEMYDPQKKRWSYLPEFPNNVAWFSVCALSNSIYVTGGILDSMIICDSWRFDSVSRSWNKIEPMCKPRARHASEALDEKLYVMGGATMNSELAMDTIECYDPLVKQWTEVGLAMFPRKHSSISCFANMVVEVGGLQGGIKVNTMDSYLCSDNGLHLESQEQFVLPEPIQFAQIVVINEIIYIIWEDSKRLIQLNPNKRTFHQMADMNYSHRNSGATVLNGQIYVAGGMIDNRPTNFFEKYDPATDVWTVEKSMMETRAFHGCVTVQL